ARAGGHGQGGRNAHPRRMDAPEVRRRQVQIERYLRQPARSPAKEGIRRVLEEASGGDPRQEVAPKSEARPGYPLGRELVREGLPQLLIAVKPTREAPRPFLKAQAAATTVRCTAT